MGILNILSIEAIQAIILACLIAVFIYFSGKEIKKKKNVNQWSYQRFSKWFGEDDFIDNDFDRKIKEIERLINDEGERNIKLIAQKTLCHFPECIMKIKYLINKRRIKNMYIDKANMFLVECSKEDEELIKKYQVFIYNRHFQIREIAIRMPGATLNNIEQIENQVFNDLVYLEEKGLLNGLIIDKVDRIIRYYSVEKHEKSKMYISMNCRNCGGLNDVPRRGKVRCEYCDTIIEDKSKREFV